MWYVKDDDDDDDNVDNADRMINRLEENAESGKSLPTFIFPPSHVMWCAFPYDVGWWTYICDLCF